MNREMTAVIYTRTPTPRGWGWHTQDEGTQIVRAQETECRAYAKRHGFLIDSVYIAPHDSPPLGLDAFRDIGHIVVSSCSIIPDLGIMASLCGAANVHLHEASSDRAVTNWKP